MNANSMDDDWEFTVSPKASATVVIVGRTGNGKSATGNSIIGKKAFKSQRSSAGVTSTCELQTTTLRDGRTVNVIDTPGLFDFSAGSDFIGKEIVKCIELAKEGIHAVLVVLSVRGRFSREEEAALQSLQTFFGQKITDYMIVVFTGGDEIEEDGDTLEGYLGRECPEPLQKILESCDKRMVMFDNKTKDVKKKDHQVQQLFSIVDSIMIKNNGRPYSDDIFAEFKMGALKLHDKRLVETLEGYPKHEISELRELMHKTYDDQLKRITEMVEVKLRETTHWLEKQLAAEQAAREEAEKMVHEAQMKSSNEIHKLRESLERAQRETEELRHRAENGRCAIL